ncbi:carbohydrate-binding family 9-like protein [Flagellimonas amoyensis]|uniref:carbohydrate-binding family 9-like protein n=1 Tax=Flagellimonas amoyensis TaxID=2169401 RepID=UPI000D3B2FCE|nr:carbohydrate-binding family 9-like protein [Allomuricauda amoyensis]
MGEDTIHIYEVRAITDGIVKEGVWESLPALTDFKQPWNTRPIQKTEFKACHDKEWLYLRYRVEDSAVHVQKVSGHKMEVVHGDRVEIFFQVDAKLNTYYCLEVDPDGRILDYTATFYREFDYEWSWPKGHLSAKAVRTESGYGVELKVSLESLKNLDILKNGVIGAGIYRGDCQNLGHFPDTESEFVWITWVDPKLQEPDFHVPSSFGRLKLVDF